MPQVEIIASSLADATVGQYYEAPLQTEGNADVVWQFDEGQLPPGLTVTPGDGITGTPTQPGTYNFSVSARQSIPDNQGGDVSDVESFTITVRAQ